MMGRNRTSPPASASAISTRRIYEIAGWRVDGTVRHRAFGGVEFVELRYALPFESTAHIGLHRERSKP